MTCGVSNVLQAFSRLYMALSIATRDDRGSFEMMNEPHTQAGGGATGHWSATMITTFEELTMKYIKAMDCEQGEGFVCQWCDEPFFHSGVEEPVCPKCGATGSKWLLRLPLPEAEDEQRTGADKAGSIPEEAGAF